MIARVLLFHSFLASAACTTPTRVGATSAGAVRATAQPPQGLQSPPAALACSCSCSACIPPPPAAATLRVLSVGDSTTLGVDGGYRCPLQDLLKAANKPFDFLGLEVDPYAATCTDRNHEGHPGWTSHHFLAAIDGMIASNPTHVLLLVGTNDVSWWIVESASAVADRVDALIARAKPTTSRRVVVGTIFPSSPPATAAEPNRPNVVAPNGTPRTALVDAYNAGLRARVEVRRAAGQNVRLADLAKVFTLSDLYDGVHPNKASNPKSARVWFDAMFAP